MKFKTVLVAAMLVAASVLPVAALDYQTVVAQQFIPRCTTILNNIGTSLVTAGLPASAIVVSIPDTNDLRFQLVAKKGAKTVTAFIELTDATHTGGAPATAVFTLWIDGNGSELTTTYNPGVARSYITDEGLTALLGKLTELEGNEPAIAVKVRAFLGL